MRARNYYVPDAWEALLSRHGWNNHQVAVACGFSDEHVANILNGVTAASRRNTKSKAYRGLTTLGATEAEIAALFSDTPVRTTLVLPKGALSRSQELGDK